jgi:hypothetical protein
MRRPLLEYYRLTLTPYQMVSPSWSARTALTEGPKYVKRPLHTFLLLPQNPEWSIRRPLLEYSRLTLTPYQMVRPSWSAKTALTEGPKYAKRPCQPLPLLPQNPWWSMCRLLLKHSRLTLTPNQVVRSARSAKTAIREGPKYAAG